MARFPQPAPGHGFLLRFGRLKMPVERCNGGLWVINPAHHREPELVALPKRRIENQLEDLREVIQDAPSDVPVSGGDLGLGDQPVGPIQSRVKDGYPQCT
jgi:hypothetical protein